MEPVQRGIEEPVQRGVEVQPMERDVALSALNVALGAWLVASSFLWPHSTAALVDSIAVGIACAAIALTSLSAPAARWLYVPLSMWTCASPWILSLRDATTTVPIVAIGAAMLLTPLTMRYMGQDDPREVVRHTAEA